MHLIGYLWSGGATDRPYLVEAFRQGLREHGWVEGQNIAIEYRFAEGRFDRLPDLAEELIRLNVDVIVTMPTPTTVVTRRATSVIPIVGIAIGDPEGLGLVASLARPGGNVTGLSYSVGVETFSKGLELLKETLPFIRRVAILWNPANPAHVLAIATVKTVAEQLGVQLQLLETSSPSHFDDAFATMAKERTEALLIFSDSMFSLHRTRLVDLATKARLPAAYGLREIAEAGGLMSYGPSLPDLWRRAANYVDKILKGAKPADLPNLKTAKALGITIPPPLLARADEVIE